MGRHMDRVSTYQPLKRKQAISVTEHWIKAQKKSVILIELFAYRPKYKDIEIRYHLSFGLIYDNRGLFLFTALDGEAGKKVDTQRKIIGNA